MILAVSMLALAAFVALGPRSLTAWARGRWLISVLATAAAGSAVYDAVRGAWLGAVILLAAAVWIGMDSKRASPAVGPDMSRSQAAAMLGVGEAASREEIETAFRRLMRRVHPDHGGAPGLASQLNAARAVMLGRR